MSSKGSPESGSGSDVRAGFQAQIRGASLADLVQMECLAGSHRVVRVASGANLGYLYFRGGGVVHAAARALVGEAAALEILSWNEGSFEPIEREWPSRESVSCSFQSLLLRAAQARDERAAQSVVALRGDPRVPRPKGAPASESLELQATPLEVAGHVLRGEDFEMILRLDASGAVLLNRGGAQDFADIVAYACRLAELIGTRLGAERLMGMECSFKSGRCFVVVEPDGNVVALRPHPHADSAALRGLLGV
jgi:hypothetical protein